MLIRILVATAAIIVYLSPNEFRYRRAQRRWVATDRPTLGRRDIDARELEQ